MPATPVSSKSSLKQQIPGGILLPKGLPKKVSFRDGVENGTTPVKEALEDVRVISPKVPSNDSIAPASPPPPLDLSETAPPLRTRLGCLRYILPNCLYDLICWLFRLSERAPPSEEELLGIAPLPAQAAAHLPVEPPLVHLERWIEKMGGDWTRSDNARTAKATRTSNRKMFHGCRLLVLIKLTLPKKEPVYFKHTHFYDATTYDNFPVEIREFYHSNLSQVNGITGYETLLVAIYPNPQMPSMSQTCVDSSRFKIADPQPHSDFVSSFHSAGLKNSKQILTRFPLLKEGKVSDADLSLPK